MMFPASGPGLSLDEEEAHHLSRPWWTDDIGHGRILPERVARAQSRHADTELEALLPTTLGGVALTIESQAGTELSTNSAAFDAFLAGLGKTRADFTLASAYARGRSRRRSEPGASKARDPRCCSRGFRRPYRLRARHL